MHARLKGHRWQIRCSLLGQASLWLHKQVLSQVHNLMCKKVCQSAPSKGGLLLSLTVSLSGINVAPQRLQRCRLRLQLRMQLLSTLQARQHFQHVRSCKLMQLLGVRTNKAKTKPGMHVSCITAQISAVTMGACVEAQRHDKQIVATMW